MTRDPDLPPPGKAWGVFRMSHVTGSSRSKPIALLHRPTFQSRVIADRVAASYDPRLSPHVEAIDPPKET